MRLDHFDLNLLVAFDALLEERSVTKAARRLNVTQSAMSASLKRLREAFGDAILLQHGKTMIPTPHALALAPEIAAAISALRRLIRPSTAFDPATATRTFASPHPTTSPRSHSSTAGALVTRRRRSARYFAADRLYAPPPGKGRVRPGADAREFLEPEHPAELLFEERHVVVGCRNNPLLAAPLTRKAFAAAGHVAVKVDGRNTSSKPVGQLGLARRVEVYAPSFIQAPWLLPETDRIALMHERLARLMAPMLGLAIAAPPFEIPAMQEMAQFHAAQEADAGLKWLRTRLRQIVAV
jgi:DNA-binding transcriptional LysR family regulator